MSYEISGRPRVGALHMATSWIVAVITGFYMLPWAIAATRQRRNTVTIAWINFLLGWTVVGWVVALVMACSSS